MVTWYSTVRQYHSPFTDGYLVCSQIFATRNCAALCILARLLIHVSQEPEWKHFLTCTASQEEHTFPTGHVRGPVARHPQGWWGELDPHCSAGGKGWYAVARLCLLDGWWRCIPALDLQAVSPLAEGSLECFAEFSIMLFEFFFHYMFSMLVFCWLYMLQMSSVCSFPLSHLIMIKFLSLT